MTRSYMGITCGVTRLSSRTGITSLALACLAGLAVLSAACGGSPSGSAGGTTSTSDQPTSTASSETSAVLTAYRAGWHAYEQASATSNADDPALAATMVNPLLDQVRRNLTSDHFSGIVATGTYTLHPKVMAITPTTATVVDCAYSTAKLVYQASGKPVPPITPPEHDGVRSTLVLTGSSWKVSTQSVTDGSCSAGS
jgi:hypothetical protein